MQTREALRLTVESREKVVSEEPVGNLRFYTIQTATRMLAATQLTLVNQSDDVAQEITWRLCKQLRANLNPHEVKIQQRDFLHE